MWWIFGGGVLIAFLWMLAPTWRVLLKSSPARAAYTRPVFWAQHSSSHG